jgi:hypothetical protein
MKQHIQYETNDGELFYDEQEAKDHEAKVVFEKYYAANPLVTINGYCVPGVLVREWVLKAVKAWVI